MQTRRYKDISNKKFNYLTAIEYVGHSNWRCKCECGNEVIFARYQLEKSIVYSCGCQKSRLLSESRSKGKVYNKRLNKIFDGMKQRCTNPNCPNYKHYGARGIKMCEEWVESYDNFYWWAMENGYKDDLSIDRIDVNGNYSPNNCRWIPQSLQQRNKRDTIRVEINGELLTLPEICEKYSLSKAAVFYRYHRGYRGKELISKSGSLKHNQKGELKSLD
ncbi:hypothetical protein [Bacillus sp. BP-3]|uniref:hypothetical protein n=1 Tax=Bacillus sp. BP-3 TaxID=3022773 RepID=UPI00232B9B3A|nr:hypothetical protein [Bacillus sp. BP-3]MDC2867530.1 hypothetical protein [Bacillus sp. BP-3]